MFANQAFSFIAVHLYTTYTMEVKGDDAEEENVIVQNLWLIVSSLLFLSMLCFGIFMALINKDYRHTFYSTITGKAFLCETWRNAKTDREKMNVFSKHKSYYKSINRELKEWLDINWDKWTDEEDWFTAKKIKKIPAELLPDRVLEKLGGIKGRKASIVKMEIAEEVQIDKVRRATAALLVPTPAGAAG